MNGCVIQVTQWQKHESMLEGWKEFLEEKGYNLLIKKKKNKEGREVFGLFRSLNQIEMEELEQKKYSLVGHSLEKRETNGRRVK